MTGGALRKYTDRDVRENPDFRLTVIDYLDQYEGEFEFLIDMKMRVASGYEMSVGMIRGVLNCMRNDPRVTGMPDPLPEEEGRVIQMPRQRRRSVQVAEPEYVEEKCPDRGTEHNSHWFPLKMRNGRQHCNGWHALTRDLVTKKARFHADYLRGRNSNIIHRSTHEGQVTFFPLNFHTTSGSYCAMHEVRPKCTPGAAWLRSPSLLTTQDVKEAEPYEVHSSNPNKKIKLCTKCFPGGDGSLWP